MKNRPCNAERYRACFTSCGGTSRLRDAHGPRKHDGSLRLYQQPDSKGRLFHDIRTHDDYDPVHIILSEGALKFLGDTDDVLNLRLISAQPTE